MCIIIMYVNVHFQEPKRIVLKQTRTLRLSGRTRKLVVKKEEAMYVPLLETLQSLLNNTTIYEQACHGIHVHPCVCSPPNYI